MNDAEFEASAIMAIRQINLMIVAQEYIPTLENEFCVALRDLNGAVARHFNPSDEPEGEDAIDDGSLPGDYKELA